MKFFIVFLVNLSRTAITMLCLQGALECWWWLVAFAHFLGLSKQSCLHPLLGSVLTNTQGLRAALLSPSLLTSVWNVTVLMVRQTSVTGFADY